MANPGSENAVGAPPREPPPGPSTSAARPPAGAGADGHRAKPTSLDALRFRLDLEHLLNRTASLFIERPAHEVDGAIVATLAEVAAFSRVDRAYVYRIDNRRDRAELTHEWMAEGIARSRSEEPFIPGTQLGRWFRALDEDQAVYIPRVADLGADWAPERARLERDGTRAAVAVPITEQGRLTGFIGFDLVRSDRFWSDDHVLLLSSVAAIMSQALSRSDAEHRFGLAFDHAPLGMALHTPDGIHLQVNPAYATLTGRPAVELEAVSVLDLIDPEDHAVLQAVGRSMMAGESDHDVLELRFVRPDGSRVWGRVHIAAVRAADRAFRYTVSHVEDITERVRQDAELRASEQRYRTLVENLPAMIVRYDHDLHPVFLSPALENFSGFSVEALTERPGSILVGQGDDALAAQVLRTVFETGARQETEFEIFTGGQSWWFQSRAVPEFDEHGDVKHVLVVSSDITALKRTEADLAHQALHDPLTALANRALLTDFVERSVVRRRDDPTGPAVLFIDLDRFKWVNDSLGHRAGDDLLVTVARRLQSIVRPSDLVARLGGDEFVVVLDDVRDPREPVRVAERIKAELSIPIDIEGTEVVTTASVGIALARRPEPDPDGLLRDADAAMYLAKANGRNRHELFDTALRTQATEKLRTEAALRRAIDHGGLEAFYQPELDLVTGEIVGFEALVRWHHPTEGLMPAWAFIELAEETGLIIDLGAWVLHEACRQAGRWRQERPDQALTMRVNLSRRQFAQPDLVDQVAAALAAGPLEPGRLCLEITETALMAEPERGLAMLDDLCRLGVALAIDDFGTGYSSLAYLKRFPVDVLKIDRSFVDGLGDDPDDTAIATAIISLARSMGLRVVAEGVETRRQLDELRRLGCDAAQGYLFAHPGPPGEAWALATPYPLAAGS